MDAEAIAESPIACTVQRMAAQPVSLCIRDTSSQEFNGQDIDGLGPLQYEAQRGVLLHPTYVVVPNRAPLGIIDSFRWVREFRDEDGVRPEDILESDRWTEGYERVAEMAASLPDTRCVYVADREEKGRWRTGCQDDLAVNGTGGIIRCRDEVRPSNGKQHPICV